MEQWTLTQATYIGVALSFHILLTVHFALRKWAFDVALRFGWIVYALSVPAFAASVFVFLRGGHWGFWTGGVLFLVFSSFGLAVEYGWKIEWRAPVLWHIFVPYVALYLATTMFFWWPLARISRPMWFVGTALFVLNTVLNVTSHHGEKK